MTSTAQVHFGRAPYEAKLDGGWLIGHFFADMTDARSSHAVEIKWSVHQAGDKRNEWTVAEDRTTACFLISGEFELQLTSGTFVLRETGDYLLWGPQINHSWKALADSVTLTVRWPSLPGHKRSSIQGTN